MKTHAASFYLSTRVLAGSKRSAIEALYGFCRFADDTADEPGADQAQRRAVFARIRDDLRRISERRAEGVHPWYPALLDAFERFPLDIGDARSLVDGCESDLDFVDVSTMDELERYSAAVAGTVGRFAMSVLGARDADSLERGERLGIAMQLTNVLRDVEEDRRAGRNYLPYDSYPAEDTAGVMRHLAARARTYYAEAGILARRVPNDGSRMAIIMARNMYEGILDAIERREYDWQAGRAFVPLGGKLRLAVRSIVHAYVGLPTIK